MNDFFDLWGTHAITGADFGSRFVTSANFKRDKYYRYRYKNAVVVYAMYFDAWGIIYKNEELNKEGEEAFTFEA